MSCPQCRGLESLFDDKTAAKEIRQYRKKGPDKTSRVLIEAIKAEGVAGLTLLDIGGGVGVIQHELLNAGARAAIHVDASTAYLSAAREEAKRQGHADRVSHYHGDFVELAPNITSVDIVTLDRVICCYPDMPALVERSSAKAGKLYGLVYPRDSWWVKLGVALINFGTWLLRNPYRFFIHPTQAVEAVLHKNGFKQCFYRKTFLWQLVVYMR